MKMVFTSAGPLNRCGLPARTNTSVSNSRAVKRRASHRMNALLIGNVSDHVNNYSGDGSGSGISETTTSGSSSGSGGSSSSGYGY